MLDSKDLVKLIKTAKSEGVRSINIGKDGDLTIEFFENAGHSEEIVKPVVIDGEDFEEKNSEREFEDTLYELDLIDPAMAERCINNGLLKTNEHGELVVQAK